MPLQAFMEVGSPEKFLVPVASVFVWDPAGTAVGLKLAAQCLGWLEVSEKGQHGESGCTATCGLKGGCCM
jgi:hypothetical protein